MSSRAERMLEEFRRRGMKVTPQRHLLCSLVAEASDHPTVEAVYARASERMATISLKTVYTTLGELAELGCIRLVSLGSGGLRVDPDPSPHAHLVCRHCGRVVDQPLHDESSSLLAKAQDLGFEIEEQDVIYRGRCVHCRRRDVGSEESVEKRVG